jgi:AraC-like DNA-binding protein
MVRVAMAERTSPGARKRYVLSAAATGLGDFIEQRGGDKARIFAASGIDERQLRRGELPLDLAAFVAMFEHAARHTGCDNFGLWYGQQFKPEMLGLIGGVAMSAPTLGDALSQFARLHGYHQQATLTQFTGKAGMMQLHYRILDGSIIERRQDAEAALGKFVNVVRHCLGPAWAPDEIHFEHPRPSGRREHEAAFSAPVFFGQRTNALLFRDDPIHRPMPKADRGKLACLRAELMRLGGNTGVVPLLDRVQGEIRSLLPDGQASIENVSNNLRLARWTLQRRLADQGFSFSDIVDLVRRALAIHYIGQPSVSVVAIAEILGYSELSAFSRAFSRWFGVCPSRFRQQQATKNGLF